MKIHKKQLFGMQVQTPLYVIVDNLIIIYINYFEICVSLYIIFYVLSQTKRTLWQFKVSITMNTNLFLYSIKSLIVDQFFYGFIFIITLLILLCLILINVYRFIINMGTFQICSDSFIKPLSPY